MKSLIFFGVLLLPALVFSQTSVVIYDSNGNLTRGTINKGNLYFNDSNGNTATGTIRNGNVYLNSSTGETTFGTIRKGDVFLTDSQGITTGTIRNGNIFLSNSDGSITTGTYNRNSMYTTTTAPTTVQSQAQVQQQQTQQQQIQQQNYEAGYVAGQAIGNVIGAAINHHREKKFCEKNPDQCSNGHKIRHDAYTERMAAMNAQIEYYHADTKRMMEETRMEIVAGSHPEAYAALWKSMVNNLCSTYPTDTYMDLDGRAKSCTGR